MAKYEFTKPELYEGIGKHCSECVGSPNLVRSCAQTQCVLHPYRPSARSGGVRDESGQLKEHFRKDAVVKAVGRFCLECMNVDLLICDSRRCPLRRLNGDIFRRLLNRFPVQPDPKTIEKGPCSQF